MESYSGMLFSEVCDKLLFDFFLVIKEDWFKKKFNFVFDLKICVFMIWE